LHAKPVCELGAGICTFAPANGETDKYNAAMQQIQRLIAIGGGGFTHKIDPDLEDFIVAVSGCQRPRVGFIGTASDDDPIKISRFYERFGTLSGHATHLAPGSDAQHTARWSQALDIIYVGGGNTQRLINHWRNTGLDQVLVNAARRGVLMAGVSAGASVWFESALSDTVGQGLQPISGIGLVAGSCCPHYDSEPQRKPALSAAIAKGDLPDGVAIDDGVALLIDGYGQASTFSARAGAGAYRITRSTQTGEAASASIQAHTALTAGTERAPGRLSK
jgi:peptidase E